MGIIDFIYPKRCPVCMDVLPPGSCLICTPCKGKIRRVEQPMCYKCGKPLADAGAEYCKMCQKSPPPFVQGISWAQYGSKYVKRMLSQVKYHDGRQLLDYPCFDMATRYENVVADWNAQAIIPVPVHKSRRRVRGYNQAEEIAQRLGTHWDIPVDSKVLLRTGKTQAQKDLNRSQRQRNLYQAFSVAEGKNPYDTVILVDDIYTTGSTASVCTKKLLEWGVSKVYVAVLAIGQDQV